MGKNKLLRDAIDRATRYEFSRLTKSSKSDGGGPDYDGRWDASTCDPYDFV